jgi:copper transport protein
VLLLGLLLGTAAPASAHAALIRTDPADGSVVKTAPQRVVLTFSEGVLLSDDSLRVLDPHGTNVATGTPGHADGPDSGATSTVTLRPGLADGTYTVAWRAISQDSHPVAGAFTFSVGAPSKTTVDPTSLTGGGGPAGDLYGIGRYVAYGGFALLVGVSVFLGVCWPRGALLRPLQMLAATGWVAMVLATIALIMLRGPYVSGGGPGQMVDLDVIRDQLETRPGAALLSRLLLLAAAAVFLAVLFGSYAKREDPEERADLAWGLGIGGTVVAVGIAATWAMAEHASVGIQHQVAMPVDIVHLLSMAVWLGGLIALLTALWAPSLAGRPVPAFAVRRFSALALTAVTLLIGTGIYQAWRQMGSWGAFTDTHYGKLLLIKIGLVCALVVVAWFSRRWTAALGRPAQAGATGAGATGAAKTSASSASAGAAKYSGAAKSAGTATSPASPGASAGSSASGAKVAAGEGVGADAGAGAAAGTGGDADAGGAKGGAKGGAAGSSASSASADAAGRGSASADAAGRDAAGGDDPARAAQLRRQQAARSAARARKALGADPARGALRRSVLAEAGIAVVLLGVTTMLSGSQPGRAAEEQKALPDAPSSSSSGSAGASGGSAPATTAPTPQSLSIPYDTGGPGGKGTAAVTLTPASAGAANDVRVVLTGPDQKPVDAPEVRMAFTLTAQHLGPIPVTLRRTAAGDWSASAVRLPLAGTWQMSVTVRTSDIDEVTEYRNVKVAP